MLYPMNVELFSESYEALMGLAHWRSSTSPEECAGFDWEQLRRGLDLIAFEIVFAPGCISLKSDSGRLKPFDRDNVHRGNALPTAAALLVLERQAMIYDFLCKVFAQIGEGSTGGDKGSSEWSTLAARSFRRSEEVGTVYQHIDGIFQSPIPNVSEISALVLGRLHYYEDELASLSSDVEYFLCHCAEYQAMRDTNHHPKHRKLETATLAPIIIGAFDDVISWHFLEEALKSHVAVIEGRDNSSKYEETFFRLADLAQNMLCYALDSLRFYSLNAHVLAKHAKRAKSLPRRRRTASDPPWKLLGYQSKEELYRVDPLLSLLGQLWCDHSNVPLVLPELNKLLLKQCELDWVNFAMMDLISEIGDLWRLLAFCHCQQPPVPGWKQGFFSQRSGLVMRYYAAIGDVMFLEDMDRGGNLERHFEGLKVGRHNGKRDEAWLGVADKYHRQLKDGIDLARRLYLAMLFERGLQSEDDIRTIEDLLTVDPSKLRPAVSPEERRRIMSPAAKVTSIEQTYVPIPQGPEENFKKSRALQQEVSSRDLEPVPANVQSPPIAKALPAESYQLTGRSYRLIDHLFHSGRHPRGSVSFQDLGRLLVELGFGQIALGGSQYRFFKDGDDTHGQRTLVIHKRHPDPTYRPADLRGIGHRLASRFGWNAGTFSSA